MNTTTILNAITCIKGVSITKKDTLAYEGFENTFIDVSVPATGASIKMALTEILGNASCFLKFSAWVTDSDLNIVSNYEATFELKDVQVLVNHITVYTSGNEWLRKDIQSSGRL